MGNKSALRELRDFYLEHLVTIDEKDQVTNEIKQIIEKGKAEGKSKEEIREILDQDSLRHRGVLDYYEMQDLLEAI
jgi:hypothetical protein